MHHRARYLIAENRAIVKISFSGVIAVGDSSRSMHFGVLLGALHIGGRDVVSELSAYKREVWNGPIVCAYRFEKPEPNIKTMFAGFVEVSEGYAETRYYRQRNDHLVISSRDMLKLFGEHVGEDCDLIIFDDMQWSAGWIQPSPAPR